MIWDVLTAIDRWPSWNPDVKAVSTSGAVTEGTESRWKSGPGTIISTIRRVESPRLMAWTGKIFGIKANHIWRLEPPDGKNNGQNGGILGGAGDAYLPRSNAIDAAERDRLGASRSESRGRAEPIH